MGAVVFLLLIVKYFCGGMSELATDAPSAVRRIPRSSSHGPLRCTAEWFGGTRSEKYFWEDPGKDKHTQHGCPLLQRNIRCTGTRGRALVLYMIQTKESPHDMQQEMWNLDHFLRFGVYGANESTEMFEGVDYIFTRMQQPILDESPEAMAESIRASSISRVTPCGRRSNIRMMWVPQGPCDLCAHGHVIDFLGGPEKIMSEYSMLVLTNAGNRGPLQHEDAPHWIDVVAMGGQSVWDEDKTPPLMVGPSLKALATHLESHFLALSTKLLKPYHAKHLKGSHCSKLKTNCISAGEHRGGMTWNGHGGWLHSLARNVTIRNRTLDLPPFQVLNKRHGVSQPLREYYDVCAAMFAKHGGSFTNSTMLKNRTAAHTAQLSLHQPLSKQLGGGQEFRKLLGECSLLRL